MTEHINHVVDHDGLSGIAKVRVIRTRYKRLRTTDWTPRKFKLHIRMTKHFLPCCWSRRISRNRECECRPDESLALRPSSLPGRRWREGSAWSPDERQYKRHQGFWRRKSNKLKSWHFSTCNTQNASWIMKNHTVTHTPACQQQNM